MPKEKLSILCYNPVLNVRASNYSIETFDIFGQLIKNDFNININYKGLHKFFLSNQKRIKNEKNLIIGFFENKNIPITDLPELIYKLRIADRNEIKINRQLKDKLSDLNKKFELTLLCNAIEEIGRRELNYFKLTGYFKRIIFTDAFFCVREDFKPADFGQRKNAIFITEEEELYRL